MLLHAEDQYNDTRPPTLICHLGYTKNSLSLSSRH